MRVSAGILLVQVKSVMNTRTKKERTFVYQKFVLQRVKEPLFYLTKTGVL